MIKYLHIKKLFFFLRTCFNVFFYQIIRSIRDPYKQTKTAQPPSPTYATLSNLNSVQANRQNIPPLPLHVCSKRHHYILESKRGFTLKIRSLHLYFLERQMLNSFWILYLYLSRLKVNAFQNDHFNRSDAYRYMGNSFIRNVCPFTKKQCVFSKAL